MKKSSGILGIIFLLLFGGYSYWAKENIQASQTLIYQESDQIQSFSLPDVEGRPISLQHVIQNNELTWVNFWATWCGPCRREMPMMSELYNEYKDKGLGIVAVNLGKKPATGLPGIKPCTGSKNWFFFKRDEAAAGYCPGAAARSRSVDFRRAVYRAGAAAAC